MREKIKKKRGEKGLKYGKRNYFRLSQCGVILCTKVCEKQMKRSNALSTLPDGNFRKGALRLSFCYLHIITRTYYFEAIY